MDKKVKVTENIVEYRKMYYQKNKSGFYKDKFTCDICHGVYTYENKSQHMKTKKHLFAVQQIELEKLKNTLSTINNISEQQIYNKKNAK